MDKKRIAISITILLILCGVVILWVHQRSVTFDNALDVPYVSQGHRFWCGPATLVMVLNFWGDNVTQQEIVSEIYFEEKNITSYSDMVKFAKKRGLSAFWCEANLTFVEEQISKGYPVIVLQQYSAIDDYGHYRVVIGFNEQYILTHDPVKGSNHIMSKKDFCDLWQPGKTFPTHNCTIVIYR